MRTEYINIKTTGESDIVDITPHLRKILDKTGLDDGLIFLNILGSTAALTTMEFEDGLKKDLEQLWAELIPYKKEYAHNFTWSDDNGHSHLRSALLKTNFFVPVTGGNLDLGTWQQVVLVEFDTRPRNRKIVAKIIE